MFGSTRMGRMRIRGLSPPQTSGYTPASVAECASVYTVQNLWFLGGREMGPKLMRPGTQDVKRKVPHVSKTYSPLPKSRPHPNTCIYCPRVNASVWSGGPLCGHMFVFQKRNYGLLLDAFLSLLEMHLGIVCAQAMGYGVLLDAFFLALENAFGMFLCSMAFFCLCMRKFQKRI